MCNVTRYRRDWDPCSFAKGYVKRSHHEEGGHTNIRVEEYTCSVNIPSFTVALVEKNERWFIVLPKCDPFKEDLCLVTEAYNAETLALLCIRQVLIGGSTRQFASVCPISCRETGRQNQFISFVGSHRAWITHPKDGLTIKCQGEQYKLNIDPNLGALLIDVPCHCQFEDGNSTDKCDPFKEDLCLVTEAYNAETLALLCIRQVLIGGSTRQFASVCPISCRETGRQNQFISFVGSHRAWITHPKDGLTIKCQGEQYKLNIDPNLGALLIDVPCHCQFEDGNSTDVYPTFPCVDKAIKFGLQTVLPAIWTKTPGLTLPSWDKTMPQFDNLDDCLNEKWINTNSENQSIPTITYYVIANFILITLSTLTYVFLHCKTQRKFLYYTDRKINPSHKKSFRFRSLKLSGPIKTFKRAQERSLPDVPDGNEYLEPNEINPRHETIRVPPNSPNSSSKSRPTQFEPERQVIQKTI
ncbi:hypothetical protein FQA39_LY18467 [Lamprigera yunnana]|nr:hypothetical protein FQA39_LY18467 [Lamprigera yunnana]